MLIYKNANLLIYKVFFFKKTEGQKSKPTGKRERCYQTIPKILHMYRKMPIKHITMFESKSENR